MSAIESRPGTAEYTRGGGIETIGSVIEVSGVDNVFVEPLSEQHLESVKAIYAKEFADEPWLQEFDQDEVDAIITDYYNNPNSMCLVLSTEEEGERVVKGFLLGTVSPGHKAIEDLKRNSRKVMSSPLGDKVTRGQDIDNALGRRHQYDSYGHVVDDLRHNISPDEMVYFAGEIVIDKEFREKEYGGGFYDLMATAVTNAREMGVRKMIAQTVTRGPMWSNVRGAIAAGMCIENGRIPIYKQAEDGQLVDLHEGERLEHVFFTLTNMKMATMMARYPEFFTAVIKGRYREAAKSALLSFASKLTKQIPWTKDKN